MFHLFLAGHLHSKSFFFLQLYRNNADIYYKALVNMPYTFYLEFIIPLVCNNKKQIQTKRVLGEVLLKGMI